MSGADTASPIEFWFDFSSGYAYFASNRIDALAARHGRTVLWRPFMLGTAFEVTGARGLSRTPLKREYARRDWERLARHAGVHFNPPAEHPLTALAATRAFYVIDATEPAEAARFARAVFCAYYAGNLDTADVDAVVAFAGTLGIGAASIRARINDQAIKDRARAEGEAAVARGVFGSPWFFVDGEPFWGADRLPMIEEWLERGGW